MVRSKDSPFDPPRVLQALGMFRRIILAEANNTQVPIVLPECLPVHSRRAMEWMLGLKAHVILTRSLSATKKALTAKTETQAANMAAGFLRTALNQRS